jgi:hypothetical protein
MYVLRAIHSRMQFFSKQVVFQSHRCSGPDPRMLEGCDTLAQNVHKIHTFSMIFSDSTYQVSCGELDATIETAV